jgi:urease accessory protein
MYMSTDDFSIGQLGTLQLADSFFPTGMYTTSHGLEALLYTKRQKITHPGELQEMIKDYLECQIGPADCTALGNSYSCSERNDLNGLHEIDRTIFSMKLVREIRDASTRSGTQLIRCLVSFVTKDELLKKFNESIKAGLATGVYPVALAIACKALDISRNNAGLVMLYGFTVSMVGAALRLGMLQHYDGQRIIHQLKPDVLRIVRNCIDRPLASMWQFAPAIDILQIKHEGLSSKMFIT